MGGENTDLLHLCNLISQHLDTILLPLFAVVNKSWSSALYCAQGGFDTSLTIAAKTNKGVIIFICKLSLYLISNILHTTPFCGRNYDVNGIKKKSYYILSLFLNSYLFQQYFSEMMSETITTTSQVYHLLLYSSFRSHFG